jgi:dephospho-CoA kinase
MIIIGVTGGIGSGKSTVCRCFEVLGAPVFYADDEAKALYTESNELKSFVLEHFGRDAYVNGQLNRSLIAQKIFGNQDLLKQLESVIHPLVGSRWDQWKQRQNYPYVIREAAILIESNSHLNCHEVLLVEAPTRLRIQWIQQRNGLTEEQISERINRQWTDEQKRPFATHRIINDNESLIMPHVLKLHQRWLSLDNKSGGF